MPGSAAPATPPVVPVTQARYDRPPVTAIVRSTGPVAASATPAVSSMRNHDTSARRTRLAGRRGATIAPRGRCRSASGATPTSTPAGDAPAARSATIVNWAAPEKISTELATASTGPSTSSAAAP